MSFPAQAAAPPRIRLLPVPFGRAFGLLQALSLDVALGIVAAGWLAARATHADLPLLWWPVLGLTAWIVYAFDHLLDTRSPQCAPSSALHRFFVRFRRPLLGIVGATLAVDLLLATGLPWKLIGVGLPVALLTLAYLAVAQRRGLALPKELAAAGLYTLALWFAPLVFGSRLDISVLLAMSAHACGALSNLLLLSLQEERADRTDLQRSWVVERGADSARRTLRLSSGLGFAAAVVALLLADDQLQVIVAIAFGLLAGWPALLDRFGRPLAPRAVRALADLAFVLLWIPASAV